MFSANILLAGSSLFLACAFSNATNSFSNLSIPSFALANSLPVTSDALKYSLADLISNVFCEIASDNILGFSIKPISCLVCISKSDNCRLTGLPSANGPIIPNTPHTAADANLSSWSASHPALRYPNEPKPAILGSIFNLLAMFNILPVP